MKNERIKIIITEDALYTKWVGAELVSAIDMKNPNAIGYVLRNRNTLTSTSMLGKPGDPNIEVYVEALGEEGRCPVAIFKMSKELYGWDSKKPETEKDTMNTLARLITENYFDVSLEWDEKEIEEIIAESVGEKDNSVN